jgi:thiol-disulfide isomerase/thioredoxin
MKTVRFLMFCLVLVFFFYSFAEGKSVSFLNDTNFESSTANGTWVVQFTATWCDRCQSLASIFENVALSVDESSSISFATIDMSRSRDAAGVCAVHKVPSIVYKHENCAEFGHYHGERSVNGLTALVKRLEVPDVEYINSLNQLNLLRNDFDNVTFLIIASSPTADGSGVSEWETNLLNMFVMAARKHKVHANFVVLNPTSPVVDAVGNTIPSLSIAKLENNRDALLMENSFSVSLGEIETFIERNNYPLISGFDVSECDVM